MDNPALQVAIFAVLMFVFAMLGMMIGAVYRRFGPRAVYALVIVIFIGIGGGIAGLILWLKDDYFGFFTDQSLGAIFAGWPLILAALFAGGGYLGIRRVVP